MKITLSNKMEIELTKEKAQALQNELRCVVSLGMFPVMEELLQVMEA